MQAHQHDKLQALIHDLAVTKGTTFGLRGTVEVVGETVIGNIPIHGIPFNLNTFFGGMDSLTRHVDIPNTLPANGTAQSINVNVHTVLTNPSNLTLISTGMALGAFYKNAYVGRVAMNNYILMPGKNYRLALLEYSPVNKNDTTALEFLQRYLEPQENRGTAKVPYDSPILVTGGNVPSGSYGGPITPFEVLQPAFRDIQLNGNAIGLAIRLLMRVDTMIDLLTAFDGPGGTPEVGLYLTFYNPVPVSIEFLHLQTDAEKAGTGTVYAHFSWTPESPGCYLPPSKGWENSPTVTKCPKTTHVVLNRGLLGSLDLIGHKMDVFNLATVRVGGKQGYIAPALHHNDFSVDATYSLNIGNTVLLNVTTAEDLIKGLLGALPKLSSQQKAHIGQGMQKMGEGGISEMVNRGLKDFVCAFEDLPFSLIHTAGCKNAKGSSSSGAPASSGAKSSGGAQSSGRNAPSSSAGGKGQPSGGGGNKPQPSSGGGGQQQQSGGGQQSSGGNNQSKRGIKVAPGSQGVKVKASPQSTLS